MEHEMKILTSIQSKMARAALNWTLDDLVSRSGVGRATIYRLEAEGIVKTSEETQQALRSTFEKAGIRFEAGAVGYPLDWEGTAAEAA